MRTICCVYHRMFFSYAVFSFCIPFTHLHNTQYTPTASDRSIQETDFTTPRPRGEYWYYTRTFKGMSYTAYCRAPKVSGESFVIDWDGTKEMPILPGEEIYLDVNELAKDKSYCSVGSVKMSPSATKIAYSVDYSGDEKYEMHVRDLVTGGEDVVLKSGVNCWRWTDWNGAKMMM